MIVKNKNNRLRNEPVGNVTLTKFKFSHTKRRLEFLEYAYQIVKYIDEVKFFNADQNSTLK